MLDSSPRMRQCSVCGCDIMARSNHPWVKCDDCKAPSRTCNGCGEIFRPKSNTTGRFCSIRCSRLPGMKARRARLTRPCSACGIPFFSKEKAQKYCSRSCHLSVWNASGQRGKTQGYAIGQTREARQGYREIKAGKGYPGADAQGWIKEHRFVMQELLGRPLEPEEEVHHRNRIRSDNRPENLEVWFGSHPRGARVVDLIDFIADFHPEEMEAALAKRRPQLKLA